MTIEAFSIKDVVVIESPPKGDHRQQRFDALSIKEAHELMTQLAEAIGSAQGFKDAMDGKVKTPSDCRKCGARSITARHVCKKVKA